MYNRSRLKIAVYLKKKTEKHKLTLLLQITPGAEVPKTVCKAGALSCEHSLAVTKLRFVLCTTEQSLWPVDKQQTPKLICISAVSLVVKKKDNTSHS